jgi:DNA-binding PadR family transcriptional regulator
MKNHHFSHLHHIPPSAQPLGGRRFHRGHHGSAEAGAENLHPPHRGPYGRAHGSHEGHEGPHHRGPRMHAGHSGPGGFGPHGGHGHGGHGEHGHGGHPGHRGGGGRGRGGDGGSRRPLERGDLRLLLLALIEQQPRHGYELIQLIGELFEGAYVPSPGVVYPTLSLLEDMGLIAAEEEGGRKRYAITDAGREQANTDRATIEAAQERTRDSARRVRKAAIPAPVREAMEQLKGTLVRRQHSWTEEEAARVAQLIAQAVAGIDPDNAPA